MSIHYFNSIKVQLELREGSALPPLLCPFQFHKGTIRTGATIMAFVHNHPYFNSIKVQLEQFA